MRHPHDGAKELSRIAEKFALLRRMIQLYGQLRGLYGDLADALHDPVASNELLAQIADAETQLLALVPQVAEAV
jgi:hypothetical protein